MIPKTVFWKWHWRLAWWHTSVIPWKATEFLKSHRNSHRSHLGLISSKGQLPAHHGWVRVWFRVSQERPDSWGLAQRICVCEAPQRPELRAPFRMVKRVLKCSWLGGKVYCENPAGRAKKTKSRHIVSLLQRQIKADVHTDCTTVLSDSVIIYTSLVFVPNTAHTAETTSHLPEWSEAERIPSLFLSLSLFQSVSIGLRGKQFKHKWKKS